jgi:hypothetical protein
MHQQDKTEIVINMQFFEGMKLDFVIGEVNGVPKSLERRVSDPMICSRMGSNYSLTLIVIRQSAWIYSAAAWNQYSIGRYGMWHSQITISVIRASVSRLWGAFFTVSPPRISANEEDAKLISDSTAATTGEDKSA